LKEEDRKKIEGLMMGIRCPKSFKCAESGFESLCKAKDVGIKEYLVCLEGTAWSCAFSVSLGNEYFCRCPVRVYLSQELKKYHGFWICASRPLWLRQILKGE
jgi:hypothetical protein